MFTVNAYRTVLEKILRGILHGISEKTYTEEETRVVNVLADESVVNILSQRNQTSGTAFNNSGYLIPGRSMLIEIDISSSDVRDNIRQRLNDLDSWLTEHSSIFGDVSDGRTIETGRHQGFVSYGSGLITFNGKPVILPKQEAYLLAHFISNAGQLVYATEIIDNYYTGESSSSPMTICSKIISPLNNRLSEITGTKPVIKTVDAQDGYILDLM